MSLRWFIAVSAFRIRSATISRCGNPRDCPQTVAPRIQGQLFSRGRVRSTGSSMQLGTFPKYFLLVLTYMWHRSSPATSVLEVSFSSQENSYTQTAGPKLLASLMSEFSIF